MSYAKRPCQVIRNDYSSTSVTTSAWVQLDSSMNADTHELEIFDSSGSVLKLGIGASGSETDIPFHIIPGGNANRIAVSIPQGSRLAIKAVDATASSGQLVINCYA
jgi:hypothetical protein